MKRKNNFDNESLNKKIRINTKEIFIKFYNNFDYYPISYLYKEFEKNIKSYNLEHEKFNFPLYHWSSYERTINIGGNHFYNLNNNSSGCVKVNRLINIKPTSNHYIDAESVYNESIDSGEPEPKKGMTISEIYNIALYWYILKKNTSYFRTTETIKDLKSMVENNSYRDGYEHTKYAVLWKFNDDPKNFIFFKDPQQNHTIAVIPKTNNGSIKVELIKHCSDNSKLKGCLDSDKSYYYAEKSHKNMLDNI